MSKKLFSKTTLDPGDHHNAKTTSKVPPIVAAPPQRAGVTTRSVTAHTKANTEPWIYRYTTTTFEQLHAILFPLMHEIAMLKENEHSYFAKRWKQLIARDQLSMTPTMTWKQTQECLGISDLTQYKDFVLKCPKIQEHIKITSTKGTIDMGMLGPEQVSLEPQNKRNSDTSILQSISTNSSFSMIQTSEIGDESPDKFHALLKIVISSFKDYIERHPNEPYSRICHEWFDIGLTEHLEPSEVYSILNISNLEDLYFLIRISPPTKHRLLVQWSNNAIEYEVITLPEKQTYEPPPTPNSEVAQTISDVQSWQIFHRTIYPIIAEWLQSSPQGHVAYAWDTALESGLTAVSNWSDVKSFMNITTFRDYYHYVANCPSITRRIKLHLDTTSGVIHYRILEVQPQAVTPQVCNQVVSTGNDICELDLPSLQGPNPCDREHKIKPETVPPDENPKLPSTKIVPVSENQIIHADQDDDFPLLHSAVFHAIDLWSHQTESKQHQLYPKWVEAKLKQLSPTSTWSETCNILKISTYEDYIAFVLDCPFIDKTMEISWDPNIGKLNYSIKQPPSSDEINSQYQKASQHYKHM
jgi:hypothetical protein